MSILHEALTQSQRTLFVLVLASVMYMMTERVKSHLDLEIEHRPSTIQYTKRRVHLSIEDNVSMLLASVAFRERSLLSTHDQPLCQSDPTGSMTGIGSRHVTESCTYPLTRARRLGRKVGDQGLLLRRVLIENRFLDPCTCLLKFCSS